MIEISRRNARLIAVLATGVAVLLSVVAVWPVRSVHAGPPAPTAIASRGDIVVRVGGVGRVVAARAGSVGALSVPAANAGQNAQATAPPDSVLAGVSARLGRFLVVPGQRVRAGAPLARLDDGGAAAIAVTEARNDVTTSLLELRQKQTSDPAKGLPPTEAELRAARLALRLARERARLVAHPSHTDVAAARLDLQRAQADLAVQTRSPGPTALNSARLAVDVAAEHLAQAQKNVPNPLDLAAAKLDLARAQADMDALRAAPPAPLPTAVQAAETAVILAQQRIAELPPGSPPSDVTAAQLELKRAQADLDSLLRPAAGPTASALAAAQAAVDTANERIAQLTAPASPPMVASAQLELRKAEAELESLRRAAAPQALAAARAAVNVARGRVYQLLRPTTSVRVSDQAEVARAVADLRTLLQRGAPAAPSDIEIAELKLQSARARLAAARLQAGRLIVRAPFAGTVTALLAAPGAPTDPPTVVATVTDLDHLAVDVSLSEFDIAKVKVGDAAALAVDALGGRAFSGRVVYVAPVGVDSGGVVTFPVRVTLAHAASVKPGMNVSVRIVVARRQGVVRVPLEAISDGAVTVVAPDGTSAPRPVSLGLADNKLVEVKRGLRAGERVLLATSGG